MSAYSALSLIYDDLRQEDNITQWIDYIKTLLDSSNVNKGARVLECGCGSGDISIALASDNYRLDAIDISSDMLVIAKEKADTNGIKINFSCQDMRHMTSHRPYDCILCINDGVNYLITLDDVNTYFKRCYDNLVDGGIFIFDISSRYKLENMNDEFFAQEKDEFSYIWANKYDNSSHCLTMDISIFISCNDDNLYEKFNEEHIQRGHSNDEIIELLENNNFIIDNIFDAFTFDKPKQNSKRIQFIAHK